jgi:Fe-S cluster assembly protein SufD
MIKSLRGHSDGATDYPLEFHRLERDCFEHDAPWLRSLRQDAIARFSKLGFPTTRQEEWKYTNVSPITKASFVPAAGLPPTTLSSDVLEHYGFGDLPAFQLVFVDGRFTPELSNLPTNSRAQVGSMAAALLEGPTDLEARLAKVVDFGEQPFVALNTAFFNDGAFVHIPKGFALREPVHLLFIATHSEERYGYHPRNLFVLEEGSQATIIENYVGPEAGSYFTNAVTEVHVGPGANLDHYKVQEESMGAYHIASTNAWLDRDSQFSSQFFSFGAALSHNALNVAFVAEGSSCFLNGLYVLDGTQHTSCLTYVDHAVPHCTSDQHYRGILDGKSRGVFQGRVMVRQDAQQTDARQTNRNLVLSRQATADTKPQLEIHADDVKCSHGATIGRLDESALFYLRSRGIDEASAHSILTRAFASEITSRIRVQPLLERIDRLLSKRLSNASVDLPPLELQPT